MQGSAISILALLLVAVLGAAAAPTLTTASSSEEREFTVVARRDDVHEVTLDGHTCQISYRAANSAHGEKWKMQLSKHGGYYTCLIEDQDRAPPHASFYGWSAHLYGAKGDELESYEVWTHEEVLLEEDGYLVEGITIRSDSHWNLNGLGKIIIKAR